MKMDIFAGGTAASLIRINDSIKDQLDQAVYRTGALYRTRVRAGASGRPGPRVKTGNYRRSISQINTHSGDRAVALVQSNAPQARRLEYGFVGRDALGRIYNQDPLPHWGPAMVGIPEELERQVKAAVNGSLGRAWRDR